MTVSIIIPIYNVSSYLPACLSSVTNQTCKGEDIECILVDDCSKDDSLSVAKSFIESYRGSIRFKLIYHEVNKGLSEARNSGIDNAEGDYIYFLDSDDSITPKCLELLTGAAAKYPNVNIVHGYAQAIPDRAYYHKDGLRSIDYLGNNAEIRSHFPDLSINAWDKLISSAFIKKHGLRFGPGIIHEDELWSFHLYRSAESIAFVHEATYIHLIRENSIMTTLTEDIERDNWHRILSEIFSTIDNPYESNIETYYLKKFTSHLDRDPVWNDISERVSYLFRISGRLMENYLFRRFQKTGDAFYKNMILDCYFLSQGSKIYRLIRHQLSKLTGISTNNG